MIRLTKVELRRLFSRRLTAIALLGALAIGGLMLFAAYTQAKPLSGPELTSQRAQFEQARKDFQVNGAQQVQDCLTQQTEVHKTDPKADLGCQQLEPKLETWGKPQAQFQQMMPQILQAASYVLAFIVFLVGAGFVAAEFSSGSIGNWLTFEPRRMRVYSSKLAAAGLGLVPVAMVFLGLLTAGVWLIVSHFGSTAGTTSKVWADLSQMAGRSVVLALAAGLVGAAMGAMLRHTAAVVGVAMGYLVLVEVVFAQFLRGAQPWLLRLNFDSWLLHDTKYFVSRCTTNVQGQYDCQDVEKVLTFGHSAAYLGLLAVLVVGLAAFVFRRRDVT